VCAQVRLTPEVIEKARSYVNPVKERELDLRGDDVVPVADDAFVAAPRSTLLAAAVVVLCVTHQRQL
jgi:hypothetical protein